MNLPQIFNYEGNQVRTIVENGEPWFVAKDVCEVLEIDSTQARRLDADEKGLRLIQTPGGTQEMVCVNEYGLYSLVLGSRKTGAKQFKRWVTHEVVPTIRKYGAYMTPETIEKTLTDPDFIIGLASRLKQANEEKSALQAQIDNDRPKVLFAESLQVSQDSILVADLAKLLKQNGMDIGEVRLFKILREEGYLIKSGSEYNMPTQRSMELKIMEIKIGHRGSSDGTVKITRTPKITGKGQIYFINKFKKRMQTA